MPHSTDSQSGVLPTPLADTVFPIGAELDEDDEELLKKETASLTQAVAQVKDAPVFSKQEADKLTASGPSVATLVDTKGKPWRPLSSWLRDPSEAVVRCRKNGLTVRIEAGNSAIALLPFVSTTGSAIQRPNIFNPNRSNHSSQIPNLRTYVNLYSFTTYETDSRSNSH